MEGIDVARKVVEIAEDKQAGDILLLDTRGSCSFADYFVILSAESERQLNAIEEEIGRELKEMGVYAHHMRGGPGVGLDSHGL